MTTLAARSKGALACAIVLAVAGCSTAYHGYDSGIDGVLWRQVASFEDPLTSRLLGPTVSDPTAYLEAIDRPWWDGAATSASELGLESGGVVLYDVSTTESTAEFSVFISSGPRVADPHEIRTYDGPSAVFTCYRVKTYLQLGVDQSMERIIFDACPAALVKTAPPDAVFASAEVFDG